MKRIHFLVSICGFILVIECQKVLHLRDVFSQNPFFGSIKESLRDVFMELKDTGESSFEEEDSDEQSFLLDRMFVEEDSNEYDVNENVATGLLRMSLALNNVNLRKSTGTLDSIVYSPLSIGTALALIFLGSNEQTFDEILYFFEQSGKLNLRRNPNLVSEQLGQIIQTLNLHSNVNKNINVATALFVKNDFAVRPLYQQTAYKYFHSSIYNVDFGSSKAENFINEWVARETNNKITQLLSGPLSPSTNIVVASTLYFKAAWLHPFISGQTKKKEFFPDGRNKSTYIEADMMANGGEFLYYKDEEFQCEMLSLPYDDNETFMHLVMPVDSDKNKLANLQQKLTADHLQSMIDRSKGHDVIFVVPKMRLESSMDLRNGLQDLGVRSLFDPTRANLDLLTSVNDLTNFIPNSVTSYLNQIHSLRENLRRTMFNSKKHSLFADQILHKVYIDVSEEGTEAAASTASGMHRSGGKLIIKFDAPFLFFIQHKETQSTLFWGAVNLPTPHY